MLYLEEWDQTDISKDSSVSKDSNKRRKMKKEKIYMDQEEVQGVLKVKLLKGMVRYVLLVP